MKYHQYRHTGHLELNYRQGTEREGYTSIYEPFISTKQHNVMFGDLLAVLPDWPLKFGV